MVCIWYVYGIMYRTQQQGAAMVLVAVLAAVGGLTTALAASYDALRLLTLHTAGAHSAFSALLNLHR